MVKRIKFSFLSNFLNSIAFMLLGAYTSSAMCVISIFIDIIFLIDEKINGKSDKITKKDVALLTILIRNAKLHKNGTIK